MIRNNPVNKSWVCILAPLLLSWRMALALAGFLGNIFLYSMRMNMNLAVVCMIRDPPINVTLVLNISATKEPEHESCVSQKLQDSSRNVNENRSS